MNYNVNVSKIYDTIFFFVEYYNQSLIKEDYKRLYDDTSSMFLYYDEVKNRMPEFSEILLPLFWINNNMATPVSAFFSRHLDFQNDDIDSFIKKIKKDSDALYQNVIDSIFFNYSNLDNKKLMPVLTPGEYVDALNSLPLSPEMKLQVALLFGNFNYAIDLLAESMRKVYSEIEILHERHLKDILFEFDRIKSDNNICLYEKALQYDKQRYDTTSVSVSLLNQYIIFNMRKDNNFFMLLGLKHEESLTDKYDECKATADNFIITFGSEIRMKILRALIENKEMTSSQMAKYIGCPPTTLIRHIDSLCNSDLIYFSKREGLQIFFKLNIKLLRRIKMDIDDIFKLLLSDEGEK